MNKKVHKNPSAKKVLFSRGKSPAEMTFKYWGYSETDETPLITQHLLVEGKDQMEKALLMKG